MQQAGGLICKSRSRILFLSVCTVADRRSASDSSVLKKKKRNSHSDSVSAAGHPARSYQPIPPDRGSQRGGGISQPWSCRVPWRPRRRRRGCSGRCRVAVLAPARQVRDPLIPASISHAPIPRLAGLARLDPLRQLALPG